ncbi:MAG: hypothetical protein M1827_002905 [Pycnora praestabilis]|nr:MAG: hypothetical protein M1827_002905 [Pycnora praestabilis]
MSGNPASPLLGEGEASNIERPASKKSSQSLRSKTSKRSVNSTEFTPLLSRDDDHRCDDDEQPNGAVSSQAASSLQSLHDRSDRKDPRARRWPTVIALTTLSVVVIIVMVTGFFVPAVVEQYAMQAMVFEPTNLSIDSFTTTGVRARVQGTFELDASRVKKSAVRNVGRAGTWVARQIESGKSNVDVYLPEYGNVLLGTAAIPQILVNIRNGHTTYIDFLTDLEPGDINGIRRVANDWLDGRLGQLRVQGKADVAFKSGIFHLGTQTISESLVFEGQDLPAIPAYNITKLNFHEVPLPSKQRGMAADVSLSLLNSYPVRFTVPPLRFDILVPNCTPNDPYIFLADATTGETEIAPREEVIVEVGGLIRELSDTFTTACPDSQTSPLDLLLGDYIHGEETTVYVRGSQSQSPDTPHWITDLISSVTVPLPFPGHTFDKLIKNFSLANVHFALPDPLADPGTPEADPSISALVKALVSLPKEMRFPIDVSRVRADAEVFYHNKKLGYLDLHKWQSANSTRIPRLGASADLEVESSVENAPLQITDDNVFADVIQALVFSGKGVMLGIKADVDVEIDTALGEFVIRKIPAEGKVAVKPLSIGGIDAVALKVGSLRILDTSAKTLLIQADVNFTNPTEYSATVPFVNINLLNNSTILGHATARNITVVPGDNKNMVVEALWDPQSQGGKEGEEVGKELLSQYISGTTPFTLEISSGRYNTTITLKTHNDTIPLQPALGKALSDFQVEIPTPKLTLPSRPGHGNGEDDDDKDDKGPHFIEDATVVPALIDILFP